MINNSPSLVQSPKLAWTLDIPEDWKNLRLKFIAKRVVVGIAEAATHAYVDEGIPIIRSTNLRANKLNSNDLRFINYDFAWKNRSKFIQALDLLTVRTGNAGVTAVVPQELDQCQCFTMLITTLKQGQNPYFYSYFLNSTPAQQYFQAESWGTAQENISVPILKEIPIPNPCREKQDKIAAFLDRKTATIDTLIAKKKRLIKLLEKKRAALINQAVTKGLNPDVPMKDSGIPWIGEIPEHWEILQVKRAFVLQRGVDITKDEQTEGDVPVVSSGGIASYHNIAYSQAPGVVIGRKGTLGKVYFLEKDYWPHDTTLWVINFYNNHPRFVYYKLLSMKLETWDTGSANPTLNRNLIHPVKISWPPLKEQSQIADYLDKESAIVDRVVSRIEKQIEKLQEYQQSLITAAVTGKLEIPLGGIA